MQNQTADVFLQLFFAHDFYPIRSDPWVVSKLNVRATPEEPYFVEAYSASILLLRTRNALLKELQQHQALWLPVLESALKLGKGSAIETVGWGADCVLGF